MKVVGISGNLTRPSRTRALVDVLVGHFTSQPGVLATVLDVAEIGPSIGGILSRKDIPIERDVPFRAVEAADLLIVGTPVYKGSYTGLLKHLFDLLDPTALAGKVAILAATGGGEKHSLVLEHELRPLLGFFGVYTVPTAIWAKDADFENYRLTAPPIDATIARAVEQAQRLLRKDPRS